MNPRDTGTVQRPGVLALKDDGTTAGVQVELSTRRQGAGEPAIAAGGLALASNS